MIWLEPWVGLDNLDWDAEKRTDYSAEWERQLVREVGPQHVLFGRPAKLIGRRFDRDDALFALETGEVAEVHLTWRKGQESDPRWPLASIFSSLDQWASESMMLDHRERQAGD